MIHLVRALIASIPRLWTARAPAKSIRGRARSIFAGGLLLSILATQAPADDTEIYVTTNPAFQKRPKVLIIFDNSGSMSTEVNDGQSRIQIAKRVVTELIDDNPGIDFGLAVYNFNASDGRNPRNGGRIVRGISEGQTDTDRTDIKNTINRLGPDTWTPLCETLYEAYLYYSGQRVRYGDDDPSATPARDRSVESNGRYISPLTDCEQAYVILMTDGLPTRDTDADAAIGALSEIGAMRGSRLDELAGWMYNSDLDGNDNNGKQRIVTYTIGFAVDDSLLDVTARNGGGAYYSADDADQLRSAFRSAVAEILSTTATFTAPTVAVNSFNRSRSLNDVYFSMFMPDSKPRWYGNLKKLRMNANGALVDADGVPATDPVTGNIAERARTFWSGSRDGATVLEGGVGELLKRRAPGTRDIWIDTGAGGALEPFAAVNTNLTPGLFGAADEQEVAQLVAWARGVDVDDEDNVESTTTRPWILGDALHSRPLVINYGARGGATQDNPDTRILFGTNAGFFHMFRGDSGREDWAFIPRELAPLQKVLRRNSPSVVHPYGIDGSATAFILDKNRDGTISGADDKVYVYFGMGRGGKSYYALDVSNPDRPRMMWTINNQTPGFELLGQTWSTPVVAQVQGLTDPALIFGGGFDTNKDSQTVGTPDKAGMGIYVVNAVTGRLVWSATPAERSSTNYSVSDMTDSIPAPVTALDSDGDGKVDRLYVGDTGGNIWRVDMAGSSLPGASQNTWSVFKFASLGGDTVATDKRFFNQVDVVQTRDGVINYDAVSIGSGNRSHPNEVGTPDRFYVLRDLAINSTYYGPGGAAVPATITEADLFDATSNVIQAGTLAQRSAAQAALNDKSGWYISFGRIGEKVLSSSITLGGTLFFASFVPNASESLCEPAGGTAYLFGVNLHNASAVYDWNPSDQSLTASDRSTHIGSRLPDTVTPHISDDEIRIVGMGPGDVVDGSATGTYGTGVKLKALGTYWYRAAE